MLKSLSMLLLLLLLLTPCLLLYAIASYCTGRLWPPCALLASMPLVESALTLRIWGQSRLGIKGHYATGAAPWALRERRAAGAAWGGGNAPGEAAWVSAGLKGAFKASLCER